MQNRNRLKKYKTSLWLPMQRRNGGGTNFFYENNKLLCNKQKSIEKTALRTFRRLNGPVNSSYRSGLGFYLLLNGICNVIEVVWCEVKERLDFQTRHFLQNESVI